MPSFRRHRACAPPPELLRARTSPCPTRARPAERAARLLSAAPPSISFCLALHRCSTSILGDVAVAAGLIGTIVLGLSEGYQPKMPPAKFDLAELPRAAGNIAFLFLIHVVILPIAQAAPPATWRCTAAHPHLPTPRA